MADTRLLAGKNKIWYRYIIVVEPRSTRDKEILFKLIAKVPVVGNTADTPNPPGLLPF